MVVPSQRPVSAAGAAAHLGCLRSGRPDCCLLRLKEQGLDLPHLVVGATPDNQIVVRSNGDAEITRSFGEDLMTIADELTSPPDPGDHDTLITGRQAPLADGHLRDQVEAWVDRAPRAAARRATSDASDRKSTRLNSSHTDISRMAS